MSQLTAVVQAGTLRLFQATPVHSMAVGSPEWHAWLAEAKSFRFTGAQGSFTVLKERAGNGRGSWYWKAYGSGESGPGRVYLGCSEELSLARLQAAAEVLAFPKASMDNATDRRTGSRQVRTAVTPSAPVLPAIATTYVGREAESAAVARLLKQGRLTTLTGTGGVGKTRLALAVAGELFGTYPDGVAWVELAPLTGADQVTRAVAAATGVREELGQPLHGTLLAALRTRRLLLVLDNCEHLVDPCAQLAQELLAACPGVQILATSREALRVPGEIPWRVPPLALPPERLQATEELTRYAAVRLLVERGVAVQPGFAVTSRNAAAIANICRRLDGIPLAIELAAARLPVLTVEQIAARLDDRFRLLMGGSRTVQPRQRTLRAAIDWSYDLLAPVGQRLFRRLAVFANGFTLAAAEAVCSGDGVDLGDVLDGLAGLIDKSLVHVDEMPAGEARYRLPETIRQYAWERLEEVGEAMPLRARHAAWCVRMAAKAEHALATGGEQLSSLAQLEAEHDNLCAALEWYLAHDAQTGLRLAIHLQQFWRVRTRLTEARRWLERLLENVPDPTSDRARALLAVGVVARDQGDFGAAQTRLEAGLTLGRTLGDPRLIVAGFCDLGILQLYLGDNARAHQLLEDGHALAEEVGDPRGLGTSLFGLGWLAGADSEFARARALFEESLARVRRLGDRWLVSRVLWQLGGVAREVGDFARSQALLEEGLAIAEELAAPQQIGAMRVELGDLAKDQGNLTEANAHYTAGLIIARRIQDRYGIARTIGGLGRVALLSDDLEGAVALMEESLALFRELEYPSGTSGMQYGLALIAWRRRDVGQAVRLLRESLAMRGKLHHVQGIAASLESLAMVAAQELPVQAARLLGAADAVRAAGGTHRPPSSLAEYRQTEDVVRGSLGEAMLAATREAGRSLTVEGAIAEALSIDLGSLTGGVQSATPPGGPDYAGLTARQVDVLRLIARGTTDSEIAESLNISLKTVHTHVSHILAKLACSNRTAATAVAIRHAIV